jgi:hypothetical protein
MMFAPGGLDRCGIEEERFGQSEDREGIRHSPAWAEVEKNQLPPEPRRGVGFGLARFLG